MSLSLLNLNFSMIILPFEGFILKTPEKLLKHCLGYLMKLIKICCNLILNVSAYVTALNFCI
ncbi:hypothetical protein BpHYR1_038286 [Brachionus plicatilis]|uniref:Uncharacterized protein n=1 Tax=Brachionus plicatilis TaxID=10195 RepID=A0A3M7PTN3_BRAPC|nr:hypothetical protein BpHYR1_038286 [Brachionus plicatilis]